MFLVQICQQQQKYNYFKILRQRKMLLQKITGIMHNFRLSSEQNNNISILYVMKPQAMYRMYIIGILK